MSAGLAHRHIDLDALRAAVPIGAILRSQGVDVVRDSGRCPCPIHGGGNPQAFSFTETLWNCFGLCGRGGDVFELVMALRECTFTQAVAVVAELAGWPTSGLPRIERVELERRQTIARRRQALRRWRDQRLSEWLLLIGNLNQEAMLLARHYMHRGRDGEDPDGGGWRLLASLHGDLQTAELMAAALMTAEEQEWARLWLQEKRGEVSTPQELR